MLFTLEALNAREGDCLILHYGQAGDPGLIVIDGGPTKTYEESLKPRLKQLKDRLAPGAALPIDMLMVTHVDLDHINGVLAWTKELEDDHDADRPLPCDVQTLWHNSFDDAGLADPAGLLAELTREPGVPLEPQLLPAAVGEQEHGSLVLAQVKEGRTLRQRAQKLGWPFNTGFRGLVQAPARGKKTVGWGDDLTLTVLSPQAARLAKLQAEWVKKIEELRQQGKLTTPAARAEAAAQYADNSVFNLSSIVVLAEAGGKKMLLTGDARGDHILEGLKGAGLWSEGEVFQVDVLKLPHHGSQANSSLELFQSIHADHYVISANGKHGNPDSPTLEWLFEARPSAAFTLWLTNREGEEGLGPRLKKFFAAKKGTHPRVKVKFRDERARSLKVDLLEAVSY